MTEAENKISDAEYLLSMIDETFANVPQIKVHHDRLRKIAATLCRHAAPSKEATPIRAALAELVACEDLKDARMECRTCAEDDALRARYYQCQPLAWEAARAALAHPQAEVSQSLAVAALADLVENVDSLLATVGQIRATLPDEDDTDIHEKWAMDELARSAGSARTALAGPAVVGDDSPGSPKHRFSYLLDELEKRFQDPEPFSASLPEVRYLAMLDAALAGAAVAVHAEPVAWLRPDTREVCTDERKRLWIESDGGYRSIAGRYTQPLYAAPPRQPTQVAPQYPLPDDLYPESKDWVAGCYAERVGWLHSMYESSKKLIASLESQLLLSQRSLLYVAREPLTDAQIDAICTSGRATRWNGDGRQYDRDTARLIEAAHGIGTTTAPKEMR